MAWNPRDALSLWEDAFDVNDHYIHVVIPFDKEAIRNHAMSRFALNEGHGTQWHSSILYRREGAAGKGRLFRSHCVPANDNYI